MRAAILTGAAALALSAAALAALPRAKPKPPPAPRIPPQVTLTLTAAAADSGWTMRLENTGTVPLRAVADARLLRFEIGGADGGAPVRCSLPDDARPQTDLHRALVLPPGRSYSEKLDPRLYCFGPKEEKALAEGAAVVARYGWPEPKNGALAQPFVVSPPDVDPASNADAGWPSPAKEIASSPLALPKAAPGPPWYAPAEGAPLLRVRMTGRTDAGAVFDQPVTVTVKNDGSRPETLVLVPASVAFDVTGPSGTPARCSLGFAPAALPEVLTTIGPAREASVSVALDRLCPSSTFDGEGLYRVVPWLDTRRIAPPPGRPLAAGTWAGEPAMVRVRQGKLVRPPPQLDPAPGAPGAAAKTPQPGADAGR